MTAMKVYRISYNDRFATIKSNNKDSHLRDHTIQSIVFNNQYAIQVLNNRLHHCYGLYKHL